ncbi:MAG: hypothetical protein Q7S68_05905 [Deltaproteobacteria bacterium]|nr:hypothetical protein [Deltaproteobacteria bacterium]
MKLFGIIGKNLEHSPSAKIYNAVFKKFGIEAHYLPFQVAQPHLKNLLRCMQLIDVAGLNITAPYKMAVLPFLEKLDVSAKTAGSVNTIAKKNNRWVGFNTDGEGFVTALKQQASLSPRGLRVTILGNGGAARGIAAALKAKGAKKIHLMGRNKKNLKKILPQTDLLIQATPVAPACPFALLPKEALVADIVYHPTVTPFLKKAQKAKRPTLDGLWMLIHQANANLKLWIGQTADPDWLRQIALS